MSSENVSRRYGVEDLVYLMARLRDPQGGCPWDLKQDYLSITPSTLEEAYEVVDAIERGDKQHLREELGDLVFQAVFYSQLAQEEGEFGFDDVISDLTAKLVRRHPHVFPDGTLESRRDSAPNTQEEKKIKASWEAIKQQEREQKGAQGLLDDVPKALPAMVRAAKLQKRAGRVGFDWENRQGVLQKLQEELAELEDAVVADSTASIEEELGDVLFTCINLARHVGCDAESALRRANTKFEQRFRQVEEGLQARSAQYQHQKFDSATLEELWLNAKSAMQNHSPEKTDE